MKATQAEIRSAFVAAYVVMGMTSGLMTGVADLGWLPGHIEAAFGLAYWPFLLIHFWLVRKMVWSLTLVYTGIFAAGWAGTEAIVFLAEQREITLWEWVVLASFFFIGALAMVYGLKNRHSIKS